MAYSTDYKDEADIIKAMQLRDRLRTQEIVKTAASVPGTFASSVREGPTAAHSYAQQFQMGSRSQSDPMQIVSMKADLLKEMGKLNSARESKGLDTLGKVFESQEKMREAVWKGIVDNAIHDEAAKAEIAKAKISAYTSLENERQGRLAKDMQFFSGGMPEAEGVKFMGLLTAMGHSVDAPQAGVGGEAIAPVTVTTILHEIQSAQNQGQPGVANKMAILADATLRSNGEPGLAEQLQSAGLAPEDRALAEKVISDVNQASESTNEIVKMAMIDEQNKKVEIDNKLLRQGVSGSKGSQLAQDFLDAWHGIGEGDPDAVSDAVDAIQHTVKALSPTDSDALPQTAKLLEELDNLPPNAPQNAREARNDIMSSDFFKAFMSDNKLTDPDAAFHLLHTEVKRALTERKIQTSVAAREQRAANGGKLFMPTMPTQNKPDTSNPVKFNPELGVLLGPDGTPMNEANKETWAKNATQEEIQRAQDAYHESEAGVPNGYQIAPENSMQDDTEGPAKKNMLSSAQTALQNPTVQGVANGLSNAQMPAPVVDHGVDTVFTSKRGGDIDANGRARETPTQILMRLVRSDGRSRAAGL